MNSLNKEYLLKIPASEFSVSTAFFSWLRHDHTTRLLYNKKHDSKQRAVVSVESCVYIRTLLLYFLCFFYICTCL